MAKKSNAEKRKMAWELYINTDMWQKDIANAVGVTEKTLGGWIKDNGWEELRTARNATNSEQLRNFYQQLTEINAAIAARDPGYRFPTTGEADIITKISRSIQRLQKNTGIGDMINTATKFLTYLQKEDLALAKQFNPHFMAFITDEMDKANKGG